MVVVDELLIVDFWLKRQGAVWWNEFTESVAIGSQRLDLWLENARKRELGGATRWAQNSMRGHSLTARFYW